MRLFTPILLVCLVYSFVGMAQNDVRSNVVFAEVLTVAGTAVATVNYDVRFEDQTHGFGLRLGAGLLGGGRQSMAFPLALNLIVGERSHCFEGALGLFIFSRKGVGSATAFAPSASYRYQPAYSGLVLRSSLAPVISKGGVLFGAGISVGYRF